MRVERDGEWGDRGQREERRKGAKGQNRRKEMGRLRIERIWEKGYSENRERGDRG